MRADWYIWFDEVVYLGPNTGQDNVWLLGTEKMLRVGMPARVELIAEYTAVNTGATSVELDFLQTTALTSQQDAYNSLYGTGVAKPTLTRGEASIPVAFGEDTGRNNEYPRGMLRAKLENGSATDWAAVRLRVRYRLLDQAALGQ